MTTTLQKQLYAAMGGIGDDLVSRAKSPTRERTLRIRRKRRIAIASVAACLLLTFASVIWVQIDLNRFAASCGGNPGTIVDGTYYFYDLNSGFYAYDPETRETTLVVSELFHDLEGVHVNSYGTYYTTSGRRNLVVRVHETGETVTLYRAESEYTHTRIVEIYEDAVLFSLYNKDLLYHSTLLLDARTGEVLETILDHADNDRAVYTFPYPVGDREIGYCSNSSVSLRHLIENGEPILIDGHMISLGGEYGHNKYAGESLIAQYRVDLPDGSTSPIRYALIRPNGENLLIPNGFIVMGGTNDYLFGRPLDADLRTLWSYCIETGEVTLLIPEYTQQEITTDGTLLYATAPWSSHTEVYRLTYDGNGHLTGLTLIDNLGDVP